MKCATPRPAIETIILTLGLLLCGLLLLALLASEAEARWTTTGRFNVMAHAEAFDEAADRYDIPAAVLAAVAAHETHCTGIEGARAPVYGPMQVSWRTWGPLLVEQGIASRAEELLDVPTGIMAGAAVLAELRRTYPGKSLAQVLCLYGVGTAALRYETDCAYGRNVARNIRRATAALWDAR